MRCINLEKSDANLFSRHTDRLDRKSSPTHVEQVFEVRTKLVNSKDIVQTFLAEVMDLWYTSYIRSHSIRG